MTQETTTVSMTKTGGWAALAAGGIGILAATALILFFTFEAPQGGDGPYRFGFLSDILPIFSSALALVVVVVLYQAQRKSAPGRSAIAALLGIAGNLFLVVIYSLFVLDRITLEQQIQGYFVSLAPLGLWLILVNILGRNNGLLPSRLVKFGILVGVAQIFSFAFLYVLDGYNAMATNPAMVTANALLLISLVVGILMGVLGYFGSPIWLAWLGGVVLREADLSDPVRTPTSIQG
jgi:hypothetical protein